MLRWSDLFIPARSNYCCWTRSGPVAEAILGRTDGWRVCVHSPPQKPSIEGALGGSSHWLPELPMTPFTEGCNSSPEFIVPINTLPGSLLQSSICKAFADLMSSCFHVTFLPCGVHFFISVISTLLPQTVAKTP